MQNETIKGLRPRKVVSDLDHVFGELKRFIMMGEFVPGQKLKLDELAQVFGTSHMPVREALNRLAVVRAIETQPRRSPRIPSATIEGLHNLLDLRVDLESKAAKLAVENCDQKLIKKLVQINERMDAETERETTKISTYLALNQEFHFALYEYCHNEDLMNLIELLWMRYGPLLNLIRNGVRLGSSHLSHTEIIDACRLSDTEAVQQSLRKDLLSASKAIETAIADTRG